MKKIIMLCVLMLFVLDLSACRTVEYNIRETEDSNTSNSQSEFSGSGELQFTESAINNEESISTASGSVWNPEEKTVLEALSFQNATSVQKELGPNRRGVSYQSENAILSFDSGMLTYAVGDSGTMSTLVYSALYVFRNNPSDAYYNADKFSRKLELSFCSREKAIEQILSTLQKLGRNNKYEIEVYSLDNKTLNEQTSLLKDACGLQDGIIEKWNEENECYYIQAVPAINDIPLLSVSHGSTQDGTYITGEQVNAIISSRGLEFLMISNAVNIDSVDSEEVNIISKDKAMNVFQELNASLLTNESYKIENIELGYYPEYVSSDHNIIKFSPAWVAKTIVSGESGRESGDEYSYISAQYLDAQTGDEIVEELG